MIHPPAFSSLKEPEQELRRTAGLLGTSTSILGSYFALGGYSGLQQVNQE